MLLKASAVFSPSLNSSCYAELGWFLQTYMSSIHNQSRTHYWICAAPDTNFSKMQNVTLQPSTMSAVTSQPLPFDRMEREKHIQMIFRAFKNRCGPACECRIHSPTSKLCRALDWGADDLPSPASMRGTKNSQLPGSKREVENQRCGAAATSGFISVLETVEKIHITARSELQGESEEFIIFSGGDRFVCV